jgi:type IV secretory pathway TraG/TraD family ATPase VirD4
MDCHSSTSDRSGCMEKQWPASNWPNEYGRPLSNSHNIRQLGADNAVSLSSKRKQAKDAFL